MFNETSCNSIPHKIKTLLMFNFSIIFVLIVFCLCEVYKLSLSKNHNKLIFPHKFLINDDFFLLQFCFLSTFLFKSSMSFNIMQNFLIFSIWISFFFHFFFKKYQPNKTKFLIILCFITNFIILDFNLITFIFCAEFLSILTFFILFFNSSTYLQERKFNVIYFFIANIIVFLFGVLFCVVMLSLVGSLNIEIVFLFIKNTTKGYFYIFLALYTLFKLGQGPIVFFKFRFYRSLNLTEILYYLFVYTVLIWPFLIFFSCKFFAIQPILHSILIIAVTATLVQFLFSYSNFVDFLVFSTWVFTWYLLMSLI